MTFQLPVVAWLYGKVDVAGDGTVMLAGEQGVAVVWAMVDMPPPPPWLTVDAILYVCSGTVDGGKNGGLPKSPGVGMRGLGWL